MTLELDRVSFTYAESAALRDVSIRIPVDGRLVALTGPNGSGKSTLLKLAARIATPATGEVRFDGRPLRDWPGKEYAKQVGYLPQNPDPTFPMTALDVVVSGRAPFLGRFGWEGDADFAAAREALALCDAAHLADRYLDEMSGGERQRIFLARVLAARPRLILLDEPLAALDVAHVQQVSALLRDIADRTGATIVFASHDLNWAAAYADRMLVLQHGTLALDASPSEVMQPDVVKQLFGFDAARIETNGRAWLVPK